MGVFIYSCSEFRLPKRFQRLCSTHDIWIIRFTFYFCTTLGDDRRLLKLVDLLDNILRILPSKSDVSSSIST